MPLSRGAGRLSRTFQSDYHHGGDGGGGGGDGDEGGGGEGGQYCIECQTIILVALEFGTPWTNAANTKQKAV